MLDITELDIIIAQLDKIPKSWGRKIAVNTLSDLVLGLKNPPGVLQLMENDIAEIVNKKFSQEKLEKYLESIIRLLDAIENNTDFLVTSKDSIYQKCRLLSLVIKNHSLPDLETESVKTEPGETEPGKSEKDKVELIDSDTDPVKSEKDKAELTKAEPIKAEEDKTELTEAVPVKSAEDKIELTEAELVKSEKDKAALVECEVVSSKLSAKEKIKEQILAIDNRIGVVPQLNSEIKLPDKQFMPKKYFNETAEKWGKTPWENPGRQSSEGKLGFISRKNKKGEKKDKEEKGQTISSVRQQLVINESSFYQKEDKALCYGCADFDLIGNLHADHLQASKDILERQLEMVTAMNTDPIFGKSMINSPANQRYIMIHNGKYCGTKKFFMEYHNAVDNLWFMHSGENAGSGKGGDDVFVWLGEHKRFGKKFLQDMKLPQKQYILYCTQDGMLLAAYARRWFYTCYNSEIRLSDFWDVNVDTPIKDVFKQVNLKRDRPKEDLNAVERKAHRKQKKARVETMISVETSAYIAKKPTKLLTAKKEKVVLEEVKNPSFSTEKSGDMKLDKTGEPLKEVEHLACPIEKAKEMELDKPANPLKEVNSPAGDADSISSQDAEVTQENLEIVRQVVSKSTKTLDDYFECVSIEYHEAKKSTKGLSKSGLGGE